MKKLLLTLTACLLLTGISRVQAQIQVALNRIVSTGNDDAEQRVSTGAMDLTSSDLEFMLDGSNAQLIGIRFGNITIPKGVVIDSAFIQFANKGDKTPVSGAATLKGQLTANAATFTTTANNISTRTTTVASVTWPGSTDTTWGNTASVANYSGPAQRTPDIKNIIQEIINQTGWVSGNALAVIATGSGVRNAQSYNGSATFAPQLIIYYRNTNFTPITFPVTKNDIWRFRDSGNINTSTWKDTTYIDSTWTFNRASFGYGDNQTTVVNFGNDTQSKHITTYFRTKVNIANSTLYDTMVFNLLADDGAVIYVNGNEVYRYNMPAGAIGANTLALTNISGINENNYVEFRLPNMFINGTNHIAVEVHQHTANSDDLNFDLAVSGQLTPITVINLPINKFSQWSYLDDGSDQDTAWRYPNFYAGRWSYGNGKLGYSDNPATTISFGSNANNKHVAYYFRKQINLPAINTVADTLILELLRDDGAIIYVNGIEVVRDNMPAGPIDYRSKSVAIIDGVGETTYYTHRISKNHFTAGINTIAVQVHQRDSISSDLGFDLALREDPRVLFITSPTTNATINGGVNLPINWVSYPSIDSINIDLSTDGGNTWNTVANKIAASLKIYNWSVPNINASNCKLRIVNSTNNLIGDTLAGTLWIYPIPTPFNPCADTLHIGCFTSVSQTRNTQLLQIPNATHRFQRIAKTGDAHSLGGTVGNNLDFTGYQGYNQSSTIGAVGVNEENTPGGVSVFYVHFDTLTGAWAKDSSGKVNLSATGLVQSTRNCSGGLTPWGTIITSEESYNTGDANTDGFTDVGWQVEYNPWTRQVMDYNNDGIKDKLWAMGRMNHENVAIANDSLTAYYAEDGGSSGVYKFVANKKMKLDSGTLYVLQRNGTSGNWIVVPNSTKTECNNVSSVISSLGGTNFNGPEDVEINPTNGMIYFTSKGNGIIYRFTDNGATVSNMENYVGGSGVSYTMSSTAGQQTVSFGTGIDNICFDNLGNLWAQQDGGQSHFWVIRPDHTPASPKVDLFATTPGGESGGLTFTPDYRYGFFSIMGQSGSNSTVTVDAATQNVVFNASSTLVIANKQYLGPLAVLPVTFATFTAAKFGENQVRLNWKTASEKNNAYFTVERSIDGATFKPIAKVTGAGNSAITRNYTFDDEKATEAVIYYRIKQTDFDGKSEYSVTRIVNMALLAAQQIQVYPNPFSNYFTINHNNNEEVTATIISIDGKTMDAIVANQTTNAITFNTNNFAPGIYFVNITTASGTQIYKLIK